MRKRAFLFLIIFLTGIVRANPIIYNPLGNFEDAVALGAAFTAESLIVSILLVYFGMSVKTVWPAFFVWNLILFFLFFLPVMFLVSSIWVAEAIVVLVDGIIIKTISILDTFQEENYKKVKWRYVFFIAVIGNLASFTIGCIMLQENPF